MSSVEWNKGNFIALSALTIKVYMAYKDAPSDHRHISDEVAALQILIGKAAQYFNGNTISSDDRHEGQKILKGCQSILGDLDFLIEKYKRLSSRNKMLVLTGVKSGKKEDIITLQERLISGTVLLNGFVRRFVILPSPIL